MPQHESILEAVVAFAQSLLHGFLHPVFHIGLPCSASHDEACPLQHLRIRRRGKNVDGIEVIE